jgi:hypothetical protein
MSVLELGKLLLVAAPAVRDAVGAIVKAFASKDEAAVRRATEATLRLAFELRNTKWKR